MAKPPAYNPGSPFNPIGPSNPLSPTNPAALGHPAGPYATESVSSSATGGTPQSPTAAGLTDQPGYLWINPGWSDQTNTYAPGSPATWGYTTTDTSQIYVGSNDHTQVSPRNVHVLVAKVAAALNLKTQKGISTEEQVIGALSKQYGLNPGYLSSSMTKPGKGGKPVPISQAVTDEQALGEILAHVTGQTSVPGGGIKTQPKLGDQNAWAQIAQSLHIQTSDSTSTSSVVKLPWQQVAMGILGSFHSSTQISQLQAQLYAAGMYDEAQMADPKKITEGNLDGYTVKALGMALQATQQANAKGQMVTWAQFLSSADNLAGSYQSGQQLGDYLNASGAIPTSTATGAKSIPQATQGQLAPSLRAAFEADVGFAPNAQQLADFTAQYNTLQQAHAGDATPFTDQQGIPMIPGIAAPQAAAGNYAVSNETAAYLGHQMGNTAALVQNAMVSNRPLNSDTNLTTAARQI